MSERRRSYERTPGALAGLAARALFLVSLAGGGLLGLAAIAGCEGAEEEVVEKAPPPKRIEAPPPPPKPAVTSVADLMAQHSIDPRIKLPENRAPNNTDDRIAVLAFFDAFARADVPSLGRMMSDLERRELESLAATPAWRSTIDKITEIRLETGSGPTGEKCVLAIFDVGDGFQPQLWEYTSIDPDGHVFEAVLTPPDMMSKLHGDNWISLWYQIREEELALATKSEEDTAWKLNVDLDDSGGSGESGSDPSEPSGPNMTPPIPGAGRRQPTRPPRAPPGPGS